jgi:hypothetical protein
MTMEFATLAAGLGKAIFPTIAKQMVTKVNSILNPTDLEKALEAGKKSADDWDASQSSYDQQLFYYCDDKRREEVIEQFFKDTGVQEELLKPINDQTTPNLEFLIATFKKITKKITSEKPNLKFLEQSIENWLKKFVDSYFEHTNTYLKFQLAKTDYLKQLSTHFDDVEFVGLKIATKEEERFAKLPQIFVMPDVVEKLDARESKSLESLIKDTIKLNRQGTANYKLQEELLNEQEITEFQQREGKKFSAQQLLKVQQGNLFCWENQELVKQL